MPDDKHKRGKADRDRVSANEPYEIKYLAKKTGLPASLVKNVVKQKGPMRSNIEPYLNRMKKNGK